MKRIVLSVLVSAGLAATAFAGDGCGGASLRVKAGAIWFQDAGKLARWQALKKAGDATALAAYEEGALKAREAWQFTDPQPVKVCRLDRKTHQIRVVMTGEGRMQGAQWVIDTAAIDK